MNIDDFPFEELADSSDTQEDLANAISERVKDKDDLKQIVRVYVHLGILDSEWLPSHDAGYIYTPYIPLMSTETVNMAEFTPKEGVMSRYAKTAIDNHFHKKIKI